jgi:hypothetical protein
MTELNAETKRNTITRTEREVLRLGDISVYLHREESRDFYRIIPLMSIQKNTNQWIGYVPQPYTLVMPMAKY